MISVVLATHNEGKNIEKCLDSVKQWADEIVVADGESTDDTVEKLKKYNARVIATTNKQNFHINKQMAMDAAKGELVLQLDADEVIDDELKKFILDIHRKIEAGEGDALPAAWWVKRLNFFYGRFLRKGGQYPDPVIRLYQKGKAKLPQKDVHEQMVVDGEVGWADGHFLHYSNPTFADYLRKFNTYTSFAAQLYYERGEKPGVLPALKAFFWSPLVTFLSLYVRHKGFMDGMAGFLFALWSGLYHTVSYLKLAELYAQHHRPA